MKVMLPEQTGTPDMKERFRREIQLLASLNHPNIASLHNAFYLGDQLIMVMELVEGEDLRTRSRNSRIPMPMLMDFAMQVLAALDYAHARGVVHRDIKPANIMVSPAGLVKVLDFGIAILRGAGALPRLTQVDRTVGTPPYMSPEQCLGQAVTSASDIYSLGCLLHELLTGDVPFHATSDVPLRHHHLRSPAPSVLVRRPGIPAVVVELALRMLAKSPGERPAAAEVYDALLPLAAEPGGSPDDSGSRDPTRPFRRPLLAPARRQGHAADHRKLSEPEAHRLMDRVGDLLREDRPSEAIRLLEDGVGRAGDDAFVELRLRHFLAAALFYAGEYTRAGSLFEVVGRDYHKYLPPGDSYVLDCSYHAGHAYAEIGKPDKALPQLRFYVQNADLSSGNDEAEKVVESRFVIAQMLVAAGYPDEAITEFEVVRPLLADTFGVDSTQVRNLEKQIGRLCSAREQGSL
jgi:hypothetical protein